MMVIYPLLVSFSITTNITVAFICSSDVQSPKLRVFDVGANQVVVAKARQFLHKLDHQIASGNQQQQLALMKNLAWMSDDAYEDVDSLKMPFVVSKRGRPSTTKRLPLAVERASQELRKEKKTKLELAKEQHGAASRGLKSTSLNAKAAGIVNQTQTMVKLEHLLQAAASNLPDYLPPGSLLDIFNPAADGNCGFRALAKAVYGSEKEWQKVKEDLLDLYRVDISRYQEIHGFDQPTIETILTNRTVVRCQLFLSIV